MRKTFLTLTVAGDLIGRDLFNLRGELGLATSPRLMTMGAGASYSSLFLLFVVQTTIHKTVLC
jgi:hypothetical protein